MLYSVLAGKPDTESGKRQVQVSRSYKGRGSVVAAHPPRRDILDSMQTKPGAYLKVEGKMTSHQSDPPSIPVFLGYIWDTPNEKERKLKSHLSGF